MKCKNGIRIIFAGTTDDSALYLHDLIKCNFNIVAVLTKSDYIKRKKILFNSVKILALKYAIPVLQPLQLNNSNILNIISRFCPDLIVVVSYGFCFTKDILNIPRFGCINIHYSLLPKWRGSAPVQRAILSGDSMTGVTIINMDEKIDSGNVIFQKECVIYETDTTGSVCNRLSLIGRKGLIKVLNIILMHNKKILGQEQDSSIVSYANKIEKSEAMLDFSLPYITLMRSIRAFNPWPVSFLVLRNKVIKVWKASIIKVDTAAKYGQIISISNGGIQIAVRGAILNLEKIQFPGKKIVSVCSLINSKHEILSTVGMICNS